MDCTLALAALLLLPLVYLFRFVGCTLILQPLYHEPEEPEEPEELRRLAVDLRVIFYPDPGTDGNDYRLEIAFDPEAADQETETVSWPPPSGETGGSWGWHPSDSEEPRRLRYLLTPTITEGEHQVWCRVTDAGESEPRQQVACPSTVTLDSDDQRITFGQGPDGPEAPFLAECSESD